MIRLWLLLVMPFVFVFWYALALLSPAGLARAIKKTGDNLLELTGQS